MGATSNWCLTMWCPRWTRSKARGKPLGIISNFSPNCESLMKQFGLAHYFDFFIVSGILGVEKPDPRIFEAALTAAGRRRLTWSMWETASFTMCRAHTRSGWERS